METILVVLIFGAGFIVLPLGLLYIFSVRPIMEYIRCTEPAEGKILNIEKTVDYSRRSNLGRRRKVSYEATCEYYYDGEKYTSEVVSPGRKFKVSEGEQLSFFVNPKNPLETHMKYKTALFENAFVTLFLLSFVVVGIMTIPQLAMQEPNDNLDATHIEEQVSNQGSQVGSESGTQVDSQNSVGQVGAGTQVGSQSSSAQEGTQAGDAQTGQNNAATATVNPETLILSNKNTKSDMNLNYIKKAKKVTVGGVNLYVPIAYNLVSEDTSGHEYKDIVTGDVFFIRVGDTTKDIDKHHSEIRNEIMEKNEIATFDTYTYNGNNFLVTHRTEGRRKLFVIAVNEKKNVYIEYEPSTKSTLEFRDLLSSIIF